MLKSIYCWKKNTYLCVIIIDNNLLLNVKRCEGHNELLITIFFIEIPDIQRSDFF